MKRFMLTAAAAVLVSQAYAADIGVSVSIGQPDFYGRIDIANYPQPQVIYAQPMIIERVPMNRPPIYLRVPPGYAKHWRRHCREYNACGERVYFVQDNWYTREYVPRYQEQHRDRRDSHENRDGGDHREDHRGDRGGERHDEDRGHNRGN
jgi:hypothetical protein